MTPGEKFDRVKYDFVNRSECFLIRQLRNFGEQVQYAQLYHVRLEELRKPLVAAAIAKWGNKLN